MESFHSKLLTIKAFIFDVDGVLSVDISSLDENGDPVRTVNVKDGYAIRNAINRGFQIGIITGGCQKRVKLRYTKLGVIYFFDNVRDKVFYLNEFSKKTGIDPIEILYMGDDLVDYRVMQQVGITACPQDAVQEIKEISLYVSGRKGGEGCVRDVIEQVMKVQNKWMDPEMIQQQSY